MKSGFAFYFKFSLSNFRSPASSAVLQVARSPHLAVVFTKAGSARAGHLPLHRALATAEPVQGEGGLDVRR
jgi:hypothetical protein